MQRKLQHIDLVKELERMQTHRSPFVDLNAVRLMLRAAAVIRELGGQNEARMDGEV
jgi:hypothetical protein